MRCVRCATHLSSTASHPNTPNARIAPVTFNSDCPHGKLPCLFNNDRVASSYFSCALHEQKSHLVVMLFPGHDHGPSFPRMPTASPFSPAKFLFLEAGAADIGFVPKRMLLPDPAYRIEITCSSTLELRRASSIVSLFLRSQRMLRQARESSIGKRGHFHVVCPLPKQLGEASSGDCGLQVKPCGPATIIQAFSKHPAKFDRNQLTTIEGTFFLLTEKLDSILYQVYGCRREAISHTATLGTVS